MKQESIEFEKLISPKHKHCININDDVYEFKPTTKNPDEECVISSIDGIFPKKNH